MTTDIKSRETILNYVARVIKCAFVRPLKHSRMKMELTSDSVKWILRKCGDLENYMFDERDFENILSKAGFPGGLVAPNYDSRFIVAHVSMCKVLPVELSHMILTFIPVTWHEEESGDDTECRYCIHVFKSVAKLQTHLQSYAHQARLRQITVPAYDRDDCDARALGLLRSIYKLDYRSFNKNDWDGRFAIGIEVLELTIERAHKPQDWEQDTQTWALREGHGGWRSEKRTGSSYARVSDPLVPAVITFKWREPRVYL